MLLRLKLHMKQFSPNEVTDEGIMIDVKLLQPEYLYVTTSQHLTYKKVEKRSGIFDN